jgi:hypothetical protein
MSDWSSRRILKELADPETRRAVLADFWRFGENQAKLLAQMHLARLMHFRDETIRKMSPEKKADLLASRIGVAELDQFLDIGLLQYHTHHATRMMAAFLDQWGVPHVDGSIESDEYTTPDPTQVRAAVKALEGQFERKDMLLYLATAGALMGDDWRAATWPVVDEMVPTQP